MFQLKVLGCGSSSGVPTIENGFGSCDPNNSKNYRTRSSVLLNFDEFYILIDTSPDFRYQALKYNIKQIDCVLYTHHHADHIAGVYDIRSFNRLQKQYIDCYLTKCTYDDLKDILAFVFKPLSCSDEIVKHERGGFYKPCLVPNIISDKKSFSLNKGKLVIKPLLHKHNKVMVCGYKFNNKVAYITDISEITPELIYEYQNLDLIIISACTLKNHPSHIKFDNIINLINTKLKPKQALLTHLSELVDYETQMTRLKSLGIYNIALCYDGLVY